MRTKQNWTGWGFWLRMMKVLDERELRRRKLTDWSESQHQSIIRAQSCIQFSHDSWALIGQRELNSPFHEIIIIIVIIFITNCSGASMQCHCEYTIHTHVYKQRKRRQGTIVSRIVESTLWPFGLRAMLSSWHSEYVRDCLRCVCVCISVE